MNIESEVKKLVRTHCATYDGGGRCLLDRPCEYWRECRHQFGEYQCLYFEHAVLPNDPKLAEIYQRAVMGRDDGGSNAGTCKACGATYERRSNRQKYCGGCRDGAAKDRTKQRVRGYRYRQRKM